MACYFNHFKTPVKFVNLFDILSNNLKYAVKLRKKKTFALATQKYVIFPYTFLVKKGRDRGTFLIQSNPHPNCMGKFLRFEP